MEKKFDCLKMKEEVQSEVYEKTKNMTFEELREYLEKSLENNALWQRLLNRSSAQNKVYSV